MSDENPTGCALTDVFDLLSRAHMLDILHLFTDGDGLYRFNAVQDAVGASPNTLSKRLKELVAAGLLTRTAYNEIPPRVDYAVTEKALELEPIFENLTAWSQRHDLEAEAPLPEQAEA